MKPENTPLGFEHGLRLIEPVKNGLYEQNLIDNNSIITFMMFMSLTHIIVRDLKSDHLIYFLQR